MVEVLSRFGLVRSRHRLSQFPATLGRAPSCDVILDEADVSAVHARVVRNADGSLTLEDNGSANGVRFQRRKTPSVPLGVRTDVRLGSAHVRFVSLTEPVAKTQLFRVSRLDRWPAVFAGLVAFVTSELFLDVYLKATRVRASEVMESLLGLTIVLVGGWAFVWSLASRVTHGRSKVVGHLAAGFFALAGVNWAGVLPPYLSSMLRLPPMPSSVLRAVLMIAVLAWLVFQNLSRVVSWSRRRLLVTVGTLALIGMAFGFTAQFASDSRYSTGLPLTDVQGPPALLLGPAPPDADLGHRIAALQKEVDAAKAEH